MVKLATVALALCVPIGIVLQSSVHERHQKEEQVRMQDITNRKLFALAEHSAGHHENACTIYRQLLADNVGGDPFTDKLEQSCRISKR